MLAPMRLDPKELLREALRLPPHARAALAEDLFESLDVEIDAEVEGRWAEEIVRRAREAREGTVQTVPIDQLRTRIAERLKSAP